MKSFSTDLRIDCACLRLLIIAFVGEWQYQYDPKLSENKQKKKAYQYVRVRLYASFCNYHKKHLIIAYNFV